MQKPFEYIEKYYGVEPFIGRRVTVHGKPGTIADDRGHYIGVNFDSDNPGDVRNVHPTDGVEYLDEAREVRKPCRWKARYQRYREYGEGFRSFIDFCRWDAAPERSWNS